MDPYLERPSLWPNVHNSLIIALRDDLVPRLRPRYYVAVEERTVRLGGDLLFAARPDVAVVEAREAHNLPSPDLELDAPAVTVLVPLPDEIRETFLEIRDVGTDRVVTVVEILSPANKATGEGRRQYKDKRLALLGSRTHLVEIDLLRAGASMPMFGAVPPSAYRLLISRAEERPQARLLPVNLRQPIPPFRLPLQPGDDEPTIDLSSLLHALYDRAGYDLRLDYATEPEPPLEGEDRAWVDTLLRAAGKRS
jgi:hypothetical protein